MVEDALTKVQSAVNKAHADMDTGMPSMVEVMPKPWPTPPTYFKLNAFTIAFQVGATCWIRSRAMLESSGAVSVVFPRRPPSPINRVVPSQTERNTSPTFREDDVGSTLKVNVSGHFNNI